MDYFDYRDGRLHAEGVDLTGLAQRYGTPCYVYSRATLERHYRAFDTAMAAHDHLICYAVKANGNLAVLNLLARLGAGFDIVSGGELERVVVAGGEPGRVVFSGVGKTEAEMRRALELGILCFNVESEAELERLDRVAGEMGRRAPVSLRVNPDVDPGTHRYIATGFSHTKFGIAYREAERIYRRAAGMVHLEVRGIDCHIGSQLTKIEPFVAALDRVLDLVDRLAAAGIEVEHLDLGGGLGITYRDERPPDPEELARVLAERLDGRTHRLLLEPGRAIMGNAGVLLTRVEYLKHAQDVAFAIVDAGMNDLLRPALYEAWHEIVPLAPRAGEARSYDVVGPVCETADLLGKQRRLALAPGDLLAVRSAGAYGFSMSSSYNARPRPAEVMADGDRAYLIRPREEVRELYAGEQVLPEDAA